MAGFLEKLLNKNGHKAVKDYDSANPKPELKDFVKDAEDELSYSAGHSAYENSLNEWNTNREKVRDDAIQNGYKSFGEKEKENKEKLEQAQRDQMALEQNQKVTAKAIGDSKSLKEAAKESGVDMNKSAEVASKDVHAVKDKNGKTIVENLADELSPESSLGKKDLNRSETETKDWNSMSAEERKNSFLKNYAATHPTVFGAIFGKDSPLTYGQRASLLGSVFTNFAANTVNGANAGFNHTSFTPSATDWEKAINQYSSQGIEKVLGAEQEAEGQSAQAEYFSSLEKEYGPEKMQEMYSALSAYGKDPEQAQKRLEAIGMKENAKDLISQLSKRISTIIDSDTQIAKYEAQIKKYEKQMKGLDAEQQKALNQQIIETRQAENEFLKKKYKIDATMYPVGQAGQAAGASLGAALKLMPSDYRLKDIHSKAEGFKDRLGCRGNINKDLQYYLDKLRG